ncbi:MAG TPA: PAS domain S-box protein [Coleofasciculaceae cyanobacterium]|jgi:PAS domain S-box-containing protein
MLVKNLQRTSLLRDCLLAASKNGIVITDPTQPDNPIVFVNPSFERITGYPEEEILGQNCRFLYAPEPNQPALGEMLAALEKRESFTCVLRNYRKNGELFWNEVSVSPVYNEAGELSNFVGICTDISDRVRMESEMVQKTKLLDAIVDHIPITLFLKDAKTLKFKLLSQSGEKLLHLNKTDWQGKFSGDLFPPEVAKRHTETDAQALACKNLLDMPPAWTPFKDGIQRLLHTKKLPILDENGEPLYLLGIVEDITLRALAEERLRQAHDELEQEVEKRTLELRRANEALLEIQDTLEHTVQARTQELLTANHKLREAAALRQSFVSTLTHDLRTPLLASRRVLVTLQGEPVIRDDENLAGLMQGFVKNNADLLKMVSNLLETYELEEGRVKPMFEAWNLYELVAECSKDPEKVAIFKGISIQNEISPNLPPITVDPFLVKRLFQNLIANALDNIKAGCHIRIQALDLESDLEIHIIDDGPGIDPSLLPQLFLPYYAKQTQPRKRIGSGLGLYICKMLVELHCGTIRVNSAPGQGTDVVITLPKQCSYVIYD